MKFDDKNRLFVVYRNWRLRRTFVDLVDSRLIKTVNYMQEREDLFPSK